MVQRKYALKLKSIFLYFFSFFYVQCLILHVPMNQLTRTHTKKPTKTTTVERCSGPSHDWYVSWDYAHRIWSACNINIEHCMVLSVNLHHNIAGLPNYRFAIIYVVFNVRSTVYGIRNSLWAVRYILSKHQRFDVIELMHHPFSVAVSGVNMSSMLVMGLFISTCQFALAKCMQQCIEVLPTSRLENDACGGRSYIRTQPNIDTRYSVGWVDFLSTK